MTWIGQLLLLLAAVATWGASRMVWVEVTSFDGLGQPKTTALDGATWSTVLVPLALMLAAAAIAPLAVHGWLLRVVALIVAAMSAVMGYLAVSLWVIRDVAVRAAHLAEVPVADLVDSQRHYGGAIVTSAAAICALTGAVLLLRSAANARPDADRFTREKASDSRDDGAAISERAIWDALDEGRDPTSPDNKGR
jgi:uncharacterized membrane protein (TIGR02234 family)